MVMLRLLIIAQLQFMVMLAELTKGLGMKRKCLCSKNTAVCQNGLYQKCMMWVCYIFIIP